MRLMCRVGDTRRGAVRTGRSNRRRRFVRPFKWAREGRAGPVMEEGVKELGASQGAGEQGDRQDKRMSLRASVIYPGHSLVE